MLLLHGLGSTWVGFTCVNIGETPISKYMRLQREGAVVRGRTAVLGTFAVSAFGMTGKGKSWELIFDGAGNYQMQ